MQLGPFAGPIFTIILIVDCIFFMFLEWWMPRENLDFVRAHWDQARFVEVRIRCHFVLPPLTTKFLQSLLREHGSGPLV
jgi:hypothetical protein